MNRRQLLQNIGQWGMGLVVSLFDIMLAQQKTAKVTPYLDA